jgi:hypothetical protein
MKIYIFQIDKYVANNSKLKCRCEQCACVQAMYFTWPINIGPNSLMFTHSSHFQFEFILVNSHKIHYKMSELMGGLGSYFFAIIGLQHFQN